MPVLVQSLPGIHREFLASARSLLGWWRKRKDLPLSQPNQTSADFGETAARRRNFCLPQTSGEARDGRRLSLPRRPQQQQGEREKQGVAHPADADRDIDGEADAARDGETGREHAGCAVDAPQPWRRPRIESGDEPHAGREAKSHEQPGGENDGDARQRPRGKGGSRKGRVGQVRQPLRQQQQVGREQAQPNEEMDPGAPASAARTEGCPARSRG